MIFHGSVSGDERGNSLSLSISRSRLFRTQRSSTIALQTSPDSHTPPTVRYHRRCRTRFARYAYPSDPMHPPNEPSNYPPPSSHSTTGRFLSTFAPNTLSSDFSATASRFMLRFRTFMPDSYCILRQKRPVSWIDKSSSAESNVEQLSPLKPAFWNPPDAPDAQNEPPMLAEAPNRNPEPALRVSFRPRPRTRTETAVIAVRLHLQAGSKYSESTAHGIAALFARNHIFSSSGRERRGIGRYRNAQPIGSDQQGIQHRPSVPNDGFPSAKRTDMVYSRKANTRIAEARKDIPGFFRDAVKEKFVPRKLQEDDTVITSIPGVPQEEVQRISKLIAETVDPVVEAEPLVDTQTTDAALPDKRAKFSRPASSAFRTKQSGLSMLNRRLNFGIGSLGGKSRAAGDKEATGEFRECTDAVGRGKNLSTRQNLLGLSDSLDQGNYRYYDGSRQIHEDPAQFDQLNTELEEDLKQISERQETPYGANELIRRAYTDQKLQQNPGIQEMVQQSLKQLVRQGK